MTYKAVSRVWVSWLWRNVVVSFLVCMVWYVAMHMLMEVFRELGDREAVAITDLIWGSGSVSLTLLVSLWAFRSALNKHFPDLA